MVEKTSWRLKEPEALWGEAKLSQNTSGLFVKHCRRGCIWLLPNPCTHARSCQADLVPESWWLACGAGLVAPATWSDADTSSAYLPCSFVAPTLQGAGVVAGDASTGLVSASAFPFFAFCPQSDTNTSQVFRPGTLKAYGTLHTGNPGDLSRGGSRVSCLSWVILSQQWLQNLPNLKASFNLMGRCLCI